MSDVRRPNDVTRPHGLADPRDAKEVIELIRAVGRKALALPGDIRDETFCKKTPRHGA